FAGREPAMRSRTRIERDTLGEIEIPEAAWYGAQTRRALGNFAITGRGADPALIRALVRAKRAAASANARAGALDAGLARSIEAAADRVLALPESAWAELFPVDSFQAGAGTSLNMNVNEVLANL